MSTVHTEQEQPHLAKEGVGRDGHQGRRWREDSSGEKAEGEKGREQRDSWGVPRR